MKLLSKIAKVFMVAAISIVTASYAETRDTFNCDASPGRRLCLNMNKASSYIQSCEGTACNMLFNKLVDSLDTFTDHYLDEFLPTDTFELSVGQMAKKLAEKICGYEITGDESLIRTVVSSENRALEQLKLIQEQAAIANVASCVITINN